MIINLLIFPPKNTLWISLFRANPHIHNVKDEVDDQ